MAALRILLIMCSVLLFPGGLAMAVTQWKGSEDFPDLLSDEFAYEESQLHDTGEKFTINDPLEPVNRIFFKFNDTMYEWIVKPITDGYIWFVPRDFRVCFKNFFVNLAMPIRLLNTLLQADLKGSGVVASRFLINSTIGVYGLVDVAAQEFDLRPRQADFGQTLGRWGVVEGIFFYWPFFGPSSARDSVGFLVDVYTHPIPYFYNNMVLNISYYTTDQINTLSLHPDLYDDLKRFSLDPYVAARQAYYENRKAFVEQ
jgi:phospholipid-binding lipoprotein MlaA